jgi:hypothetical protein
MKIAAATAYLETAGPVTTISEIQRNNMADLLARMVTVYCVSGESHTIMAVSREEIRLGSFTDSGRVLTFKGGRQPISDLMVTKSALKAAIEAIKAKKPGGVQ